MIIKEKKFSKECIEEVIKTLELNNINWWVDHGSLLGLVREGHFIQWDSDVDLGAWYENARKVQDILVALAKKYEYVSYNPLTNAISVRLYDELLAQYWSIDVAFYFISSGIATKYYVDTSTKIGRILGRLLTVVSGDLAPVSNRFIINYLIIGLRKIYKFVPYGLSRRVAVLVGKLTPKRKNEVESYFFEKIEKNLTPYGFLCFPVRAKEYLECRYGSDWKTPKREWNFLLDDHCVK